MEPAELEYLGTLVEVIVDRPMGSKHPDNGMIYPINYGYVPGTIAGDGEEIDAYILGVDQPLARVQGSVVALIIRENDVENKLVVNADDSRVYNEPDIVELTRFQEQYFRIKIRLA